MECGLQLGAWDELCGVTVASLWRHLLDTQAARIRRALPQQSRVERRAPRAKGALLELADAGVDRLSPGALERAWLVAARRARRHSCRLVPGARRQSNKFKKGMSNAFIHTSFTVTVTVDSALALRQRHAPSPKPKQDPQVPSLTPQPPPPVYVIHTTLLLYEIINEIASSRQSINPPAAKTKAKK